MPNWGGRIEIKREDFDNTGDHEKNLIFERFKIINTCSIDYFLFGLWFSFDLSLNLQIQIVQNTELTCDYSTTYLKIKKIIELIQKKEWNRVKTIWILQLLDLKPDRRTFCTFGNEFYMYGRFLKTLQTMKIKCSNKDCLLPIEQEFKEFNFIRNSKNEIIFNKLFTCQYCVDSSSEFQFCSKPCWLFIEINYKSNQEFIWIDEVPTDLDLAHCKYKLLYGTCFSEKQKHFTCLLRKVNNFYLVDDLSSSFEEVDPTRHRIYSAMYYLA